jgi:hypothetical protein
MQDRFANFDLLEESIDGNSTGLKCELKSYEARFNVRGERVALQVNTRRGIEENKDRDHESGFVVTRWCDKDKALECTDLEVQSPHAKVALRSVIGQYPGVNLHSKKSRSPRSSEIRLPLSEGTGSIQADSEQQRCF